MPIYEYRCAACGHTLEALQKLSESPLKKCPECKKSSLKRLMSAPSFRLKGGGWYETDFKSDGEKKRNLVEASGAGSKESSGVDAPKEDRPKADVAKADSPKADSPKAESSTKDSKGKETSGTSSKDAKPAAKESTGKKSTKQSSQRPASS